MAKPRCIWAPTLWRWRRSPRGSAYLLDGDWAVITPKGVTIRDGSDAIVRRETLVSQASALMVDKGNHRHFMAKEIYEQPETISHTLSHYVDMGAEKVALREKLPFDFADAAAG